MPLIKSSSKKAVGENIKKEMESGRPQKQSIAIALATQRAARKKKMAKGGMAMQHASESEIHSEHVPSGHIHMDPEHLRKEHEEDMEGPHSERMRSAHPHIGESYSDGGEVFASERGQRERPPVSARYPESHPSERRLPDRRGLEPDMEEPHHMDMYPEGLDEENPELREADGYAHGGSIAERIMSKRSGYADGGEVDLSINADESPNMEDRYSFDALRKENYSESDGLDELHQPEDSNEHGDEIDHDEHDMIDKIRAKMKRAGRGMMRG